MTLNWIDLKIVSRTATFISEPDYSLDVHEGRERYDGTRMPARPFMDAAVNELDVEQVFLAEYADGHDLNVAFDLTSLALYGAIKDQIMSNNWSWDRQTTRSSGAVVDSPRDIVDTGNLLNGQRLFTDEHSAIPDQ